MFNANDFDTALSEFNAQVTFSRTDPASLSYIKLENSLFLAFEIESNITLCSLKPLSVQQLVKNFHLGILNT